LQGLSDSSGIVFSFRLFFFLLSGSNPNEVMHRIVIFASGSGTNAENIIRHFKSSSMARVKWVLCNKEGAGVLSRAERLGVPTRVFTKKELFSKEFLDFVIAEGDFVVLAGFLLKVPDELTRAFEGAMVNIHPALLPKYGGKGMYGMNVHRAVVENREKESGITIHFVNENYDEGAIIFQAKVAVDEDDRPEDVARKIHILEQENFPAVIEQVIRKADEG
jgi:phosphoribosylglycinamide formyltransferase-1